MEIQTASGIVRSTTETKVCVQELGTYLYVKLLVREDTIPTRHDTARRNFVPGKEGNDSVYQPLEPILTTNYRRRRSTDQTIPLAEKEARSPLANTTLPSFVTDAGGAFTPKPKRGNREPTMPNQTEITMCQCISQKIRIVMFPGGPTPRAQHAQADLFNAPMGSHRPPHLETALRLP